MPLDEQSRRLTQFVIRNQQNEFNRLFYGSSIGPAAFSAFILRPQMFKKKCNHLFRRCFYAITNKRRNVPCPKKISIKFYYKKTCKQLQINQSVF